MLRCPRTYSGRCSCLSRGRGNRRLSTDGHGRAALAACPGLTAAAEQGVHPVCAPGGPRDSWDDGGEQLAESSLERRTATVTVAAKGFDSTGSKLTDAVREIEEMAEVRLSRQYVMAVIDGIGWKSRISDLRRTYDLWQSQQIDGMYSLANMHQFREDLYEAARIRRLTQ
jgi:hypothetical protein